jgi:hypothetical protein
MRVEILGIEQHLPNGATQGFIDLPRRGWKGSGFSISVQGWVLGPAGPPQAIQIGTELSGSARTPMNVKRADIAAKFPQISDSANSGFRTQVSLVPLPRRFDVGVRARFADGSVVKVATITGRREALVEEPDESLMRPLMITTLGRTGSTWAVRLLAQHPSIVAYRPFEYEPRITSYWAGVLMGLSEPASYFQALDSDSIVGPWWLGAGRLRPLPLRLIDAEIEDWFTGSSVERLARFGRTQIEAFYRIVAQLQARSDPTFFIEKTWPDAVPATVWDLYPNAREIVLVRDVRDMVCSMLAFNAKRGFNAFGRADAPSDEHFIRGLRNSVKRLIDSWRERASSVYLLRYEDLVLEPMRTIESVLKYLGIDIDEASAARMITEAATDRHEGHRTASTPEESVGRWRNDLDAQQQALCMEAFGDLLPILGYE